MRGPPFTIEGLKRSAVIVGIDNNGPSEAYGFNIPNLLSAAGDARAVSECLREKHGYDECVLLQNEQATKHGILTALDSLAEQVTEKHQVIFYFAGHGIAREDEKGLLQGFIIPAGAIRGKEETYIPMSRLRDILHGMPCQHLLVVLDCCYAGAFGKPTKREFDVLSTNRTPEPVYARWLKHRSYHLLVSASHDEQASDCLEGPDPLMARVKTEQMSSNSQHSPFALAFLQGIEPGKGADHNDDGVVTPHELAVYIDNVFTTIDRRNHLLGHSLLQQTPHLRTLDWHDGGQFLFLVSEPKPEPVENLTLSHNPYRGLQAFEKKHQSIFFGRERVVRDLIRQMQQQRMTAIVGPSGAGKSSLIQAGVLPLLESKKHGWKILGCLRPGGEPLTILRGKLVTIQAELSANTPPTPLLLVIDQLEELVTMTRQSSEQVIFLQVLSLFLRDDVGALDIGRVLRDCSNNVHARLAEEIINLLWHQRPRLKILVTLRDDYEEQIIRMLSWSNDKSAMEAAETAWYQSRHVIPAMNRDELRECIEKPAAERYVFFDTALGPRSKYLVETLLDEVENTPGRLPLLSVALSEMFNHFLRRGSPERTILWEDYVAVGGVAQALQKKAEAIYANPYPAARSTEKSAPLDIAALQHTLLRIMLRMVALEAGELSRRRISAQELVYTDPDEQKRVDCVIEALESERLVLGVNPKVSYKPIDQQSTLPQLVLMPPETVMKQSEAGSERYIEPAHDRLVKGWPRLSELIKKSQSKLILQRNLWEAARSWQIHRHKDELWDDARILRLKELSESSEKKKDAPGAPDKKATSLLSLVHRLQMQFRTAVEGLSIKALLRSVPSHTLNKIEDTFVKESFRVRRRRFLTIAIAIMLIFGTLVGMLLVAWTQYELAKQQSEKTTEAKKSLETTLDLTEDAAFKVADTIKSLRDIAGGAKAREDLLNSIQELQTKLMQGQSPTEKNTDNIRAIYFELARLEMTHGTLDKADQMYELGCGEAERLLEKHPENNTYQHYRSLCYRERSIIAAQNENFQAADEYLLKAEEIIRPLLKAEPIHALLVLDNGANLNHRGRLAFRKCVMTSGSRCNKDLLKPSLASLEKSLEILGQLQKDKPSNTGPAIEWPAHNDDILSEKARVVADNYYWLGVIEKGFRDWKEAARYLTAAVDTINEQMKVEPASSSLRRSLSLVHHQLAELSWNERARAPAIEHFRKTLELHFGLAEEDPRNLRWKKDIAVACKSDIGKTMQRLDRVIAARCKAND